MLQMADQVPEEVRKEQADVKKAEQQVMKREFKKTNQPPPPKQNTNKRK